MVGSERRKLERGTNSGYELENILGSHLSSACLGEIQRNIAEASRIVLLPRPLPIPTLGYETLTGTYKK